MRVGTRLLLAVVPAVIGIAAVAGLAYWGQYAHEAPAVVVVIAAIGAVASLLLAWQNTRYVARRVERIAAKSASSGRGGGDELERIERSVGGLEEAVDAERARGAEREAAAARRAAAYQAHLSEILASTGDAVQAVQLPLHILLDSPFGALNENQEEMLEAARAAAEQLDVRLRQARKLLDVERGAVAVRVRPIGLPELMRPALAIAEARAAKRGVTFESAVSPVAPRALVDPMHAQEAVTLALGEAIERAAPGSTLRADAEASGDHAVSIRVRGAGAISGSIPLELAEALLRAQHGTLRREDDGLTIELPAEGSGRSAP